jgi:hypothetical protein
MDNELHEWFTVIMGRRLPVTCHDLQEKALEPFATWWDNLDEDVRNEIVQLKQNIHQFHASNGWVCEFMQRKNISYRKSNKNTTTIPADAAARVAAGKGSSSVDMRTSRSNTKLGCTVSWCITATGTKIPAHITFPRRGFVRLLNFIYLVYF